MKKEFKAPIVEAKQLSVQDNVMFGTMLTSLGQNPTDFSSMSDAVSEDYKQWKGFSK